ncbi:MAG: hypothetical protein R3F37_06220 [Candidatus Competibacteraceae bacterium]
MHLILFICALTVMELLSIERVLAQEPGCDKVVAKLVSAQGEVAIRRAGRENWQTVPADQIEQALCVGDSIRTGPRSRATVQAPAAETTATIDANTVLTITVSQPNNPSG